jgi:hypothetical protein
MLRYEFYLVAWVDFRVGHLAYDLYDKCLRSGEKEPALIGRSKLTINDEVYPLGGPMRRTLLLTGMSLFLILVTACSTQPVAMLAMAPMSALPEDIQGSAVEVSDAYRFALANQDILEQVPCYCGCGGVGHTSNYTCYVADENADGEITFDYHSYG